MLVQKERERSEGKLENQAPMADQSPSGTELPQNQNEELDEAEPVFLQSQEEEDDDEESVPSEDDGVHTSVGELVSHGDEDDENEDQEIKDEDGDGDGDGEESCSSGEEGGSEGNEWSAAQIVGLFCPNCFHPWTTDGDHYICCHPCGHICGMSCIQAWFERFQNRGKCTQCKSRCTLKNVRKLFALRVVAIDDEAQKRVVWSKKEAKWRKIEAELRLEVQQLKEVDNRFAQNERDLQALRQWFTQQAAYEDDFRTYLANFHRWMDQMMRMFATHMGVDIAQFPTLPPYPGASSFPPRPPEGNVKDEGGDKEEA